MLVIHYFACERRPLLPTATSVSRYRRFRANIGRLSRYSSQKDACAAFMSYISLLGTCGFPSFQGSSACYLLIPDACEPKEVSARVLHFLFRTMAVISASDPNRSTTTDPNDVIRGLSFSFSSPLSRTRDGMGYRVSEH